MLINRKKEKKSGGITNIPDTGKKIRIIIVLCVINVLLLLSYFLLAHFAVKNVIVDGNKHYTAKEIQSMVTLATIHCTCH